MNSVSKKSSQQRKRILLGQLMALGDCLYATTIARQIKRDNPDCHLTWAISSPCRSILIGNPHVDDIWEVFSSGRHGENEVWDQFEHKARERKQAGEFDEIYLTQIHPNNWKNFDGTVRASIFRGYPRPISVPVNPVIKLLPEEIENTKKFANKHSLTKKSDVILFEYNFDSGQSFVTSDFALEVSEQIIKAIPTACIILSAKKPIQTSNKNIIDGSKLSFRENAELTKYCSLFIGCSSGLSWLCTSEWAKPLPMIQLLSKKCSVFASFVHDYEFRGENTDSIIEMTECSSDKLIECVVCSLTKGFKNAKLRFHERIPLNFDYYCKSLFWCIKKGRYQQVLRSISVTIKRYGLNFQLLKSLVFICIYYSPRYFLNLFSNSRK